MLLTETTPFPPRLVTTGIRENGSPGKLSRGIHLSRPLRTDKVHDEWQYNFIVGLLPTTEDTFSAV